MVDKDKDKDKEHRHPMDEPRRAKRVLQPVIDAGMERVYQALEASVDPLTDQQLRDAFVSGIVFTA